MVDQYSLLISVITGWESRLFSPVEAPKLHFKELFKEIKGNFNRMFYFSNAQMSLWFCRRPKDHDSHSLHIDFSSSVISSFNRSFCLIFSVTCFMYLFIYFLCLFHGLIFFYFCIFKKELFCYQLPQFLSIVKTLKHSKIEYTKNVREIAV